MSNVPPDSTNVAVTVLISQQANTVLTPSTLESIFKKSSFKTKSARMSLIYSPPAKFFDIPRKLYPSFSNSKVKIGSSPTNFLTTTEVISF